MLNKKLLRLLSSALLIGMLAGCGTSGSTKDNVKENASGSSDTVKTETPSKTETSNQNEIAAKLQASVETKEEKTDVVVTYKVKNLSGESKKLTFPSGLEADYVLYDQNGQVLKKYSDEVSSTQAVKEETIENNQEMVKEFKIPGLLNGHYKIEVFLTANEEDVKATKEFAVANSAYKQGQGELVGLMDPHSIEVKENGESVAYQLSQNAQQKISNYQDGTQISFIYIENEYEQKVIETFVKK